MHVSKRRSKKEVTCLIEISRIDNAIQCIIIYHEISGHYGSKLKLQIKSLELHDILCTNNCSLLLKYCYFNFFNPFRVENFRSQFPGLKMNSE